MLSLHHNHQSIKIYLVVESTNNIIFCTQLFRTNKIVVNKFMRIGSSKKVYLELHVHVHFNYNAAFTR